ncbi:MAG: hypothetical protein O2856_14360 [Planctomycetota bacterium]|nr:hypothetical protein [Planctomycetota bacterium]
MSQNEVSKNISESRTIQGREATRQQSKVFTRSFRILNQRRVLNRRFGNLE